MKFTIKQSALKDALAAVQGALERKSTIPVLSNVLIRSIGERYIQVTATDLDVTIRSTAEADVQKAGAICVQARKLTEIVRTLPNIELHFEQEPNDWVQMKAGKSKTRLAGVSSDKFAKMPEHKATPIKLPAATLSALINGTAYAVTTDVSRFTLSGCKLEIADGKARMIATDGHRLPLREYAIDDKDSTLAVLIPKKALNEIAKIVEGDVSIGADREHFFVESDGQIIAARLLTGQFPNYEMLLPKEEGRLATCSVEELRSAVRRAAVLSEERNDSVRLHIETGEIRVKAQSRDEGEADEFVDAEFSGEPTVLGFNYRYLLDALSVGSSSAKVVINVQDGANLPTEFNFSDDKSYRGIVMPLRI